MINQRFVVQLDRRTVGIAVRMPGGFVFYASDDEFDEIDGCIFKRARTIERQLVKVARKQRLANRHSRQMSATALARASPHPEFHQ